jgi:hypothetical protein
MNKPHDLVPLDELGKSLKIIHRIRSRTRDLLISVKLKVSEKYGLDGNRTPVKAGVRLSIYLSIYLSMIEMSGVILPCPTSHIIVTGTILPSHLFTYGDLLIP